MNTKFLNASVSRSCSKIFQNKLWVSGWYTIDYVFNIYLSSLVAESPEAVEGSRKEIQRCFTLEEATDTILLCSSIVHDLAYKAATIALDHEQERVHAEPTRPSVTIVGKSIPKEDGLLKLTHRRTPNRKVKRKRLEGETTITENAEKKDDISTDHSPVRSSSGITRTSESMKPPKLESKCNCIIM